MTRRTARWLLLTLLIPAGILFWDSSRVGLDRVDACAAYLAGDKGAPSSVYVHSGSSEILVSCNVWILRQPQIIQVSCFAEAVFLVIFCVCWAGDWLAARRERQARRP